MPRNAAGVYALPLPPVVAGNTIMASFENGTDNDIASELTNSLDRNGRGGMLAPFKIFDGTVGAPGMAFTQDPDNGIYRIGTDHWALAAGGAAIMDMTPTQTGISTPLWLGGVLTATAGITLSGTTQVTGNVDIQGSVGSIAQAAPQHKLSLSSAGPSDAAYMAFNILGAYASLFGLSADGKWRVGGWSAGAVQYQILHEGNSFNFNAANTLSTGLNISAPTLYATYDVVAGRNVGITGNLTAGSINSNSYVTGADHFANRAVDQGVYFFGSGGGRYLQFDGAYFRFMTGSILQPGASSFGHLQDPKGAIDVMASGVGDRHFTITAQGANNAYLAIGCINDAYTAWQNLAFQGGGSFHPAYDGAQALGNLAERWNAVYAQNGAINTSDARLKKDIVDSPLGLSFIETLRPVQYKWIAERTIVTPVQTGTKPVPETVDIDGNVTPAHDEPVMGNTVTPVPGVRPHWGLIAQEVRGALATAGFADNGIVALSEVEDVAVGLNYSEFIAPLVAAVQELSARVRTLEAAPV